MNVYIAGDSTVQTYHETESRQAGWGQFISEYFSCEVSFFNHAIGGRSSKSFIEEGRLEEILSDITKDDYLFIQMGHNDSTKSKPERYTEPYGDYKTYLKRYIEEVRRKEAIPILITPVARLHYVNGEYLADFGDYCNAMKEVAEEMNVLLIDLMKESIAYFTSINYETVYSFFMVSENGTDHTHFTEKGAREIAKIVSNAIKTLPITLSKYLIKE